MVDRPAKWYYGYNIKTWWKSQNDLKESLAWHAQQAPVAGKVSWQVNQSSIMAWTFRGSLGAPISVHAFSETERTEESWVITIQTKVVTRVKRPLDFKSIGRFFVELNT